MPSINSIKGWRPCRRTSCQQQAVICVLEGGGKLALHDAFAGVLWEHQDVEAGVRAGQPCCVDPRPASSSCVTVSRRCLILSFWFSLYALPVLTLLWMVKR